MEKKKKAMATPTFQLLRPKTMESSLTYPFLSYSILTANPVNFIFICFYFMFFLFCSFFVVCVCVCVCCWRLNYGVRHARQVLYY
jgi:hypothetical protein